MLYGSYDADLLYRDNVIRVYQINGCSITFMDARKHKSALYYSQCRRDSQRNIVRSKWWRDSISKINPNNERKQDNDQAESAGDHQPAAMVVIVEFEQGRFVANGYCG